MRKNPLSLQIIDIINNSKLSQNDKCLLFKELSSLVLNITSPYFKSKLNQSQVITNSLNSTIGLISRLNREGKIDEQEVVNLVKSLSNRQRDPSFIESVKKVKDLKELLSFLSDNFDTIKVFLFTELKGGSGFENAIRYFVAKHRLGENIAKSGGNLVGRLERIFDFNATDAILSMRKTLLEDRGSIAKLPQKKTEVQQAIYDMGDIVFGRILKKLFGQIRSKLNLQDADQKRLTREDMVNSTFSGIQEVFRDSRLKNRVFENLKKLGVEVEDKK